jgi:hypothetical protein
VDTASREEDASKREGSKNNPANKKKKPAKFRIGGLGYCSERNQDNPRALPVLMKSGPGSRFLFDAFSSREAVST